MKRITFVFLTVAFGLAIPLLGDGAKKAQPLAEPQSDDAKVEVTEHAYPLPSRQADVLALLLRLYPPMDTEAKTEPKDRHLALVVKGPARVHEAVGKFVEFLNAEEVARDKEQEQQFIKKGHTKFIVKPAKP